MSEELRPLRQPWGTGEIRLNDDGTIDEIVAKGVDFHLEQMSDQYWWMGLYLPDGRSLHVNLYSLKAHVHANASCEGQDHVEDRREFGRFGGAVVPTPIVPEKYRK